MLKKSEIRDLITRLSRLADEVDRLVLRISEDSSGIFKNVPEMAGKLPMLDFYNDDLKRTIADLRELEAELPDE